MTIGLKSRCLAATAAVLAAGLGASLAAAGPASADPSGGYVTMAYSAAGSSTIGGIGSTVPIGPTTLTISDDINGNLFNGSMPLPDVQSNFTVAGIIPVRATVSFTEVSPVSGNLVAGNTTMVRSHVQYQIRLSNVSANVFGIWWPLGVGSDCRTINPVTIEADTPAGQYFDIVDGGTLAGTYTIGNFQNCTPLNFLSIPGFDFFGIGSIPVNALVPGTNNTVSIQVSNGQFVGSG